MIYVAKQLEFPPLHTLHTFTCISIAVPYSILPTPYPNPFPVSMTLEETIETILFQETTSIAQHKFTHRVNRDICHSHSQSHSHIHIHSHRATASLLLPSLYLPYPLTPPPSLLLHMWSIAGTILKRLLHFASVRFQCRGFFYCIEQA